LSPRAWLAGSAPRRAGIGLRAAHHGDWIAQRPDVGWFEIHAENYFAEGGLLPDILGTLRRDLPLSIHGVGLGIASTDRLDATHLRQLARLADRYQPAVISEHLCWGNAHGIHYNDLLPFPFTSEMLEHVAARVQLVQEQLRRPILLEHLSSYVTFAESTLSETEFLTELVHRTDCGLLLDLNNLVVNAENVSWRACPPMLSARSISPDTGIIDMAIEPCASTRTIGRCPIEFGIFIVSPFISSARDRP